MDLGRRQGLRIRDIEDTHRHERRHPGTATTIRRSSASRLISDGPFVDSKEFLGGLIVVEADNLDGALALAAELQELDLTVAIEVRPVLEQVHRGA